MSEADGTGYPIRAVTRVCDILDQLQDQPDGVILTNIAAHTEMPKSSAFRYLAALEERQYVERDEATGLYRLGLAFRPLQTRSLDQLIEVARPELEKLRAATGETINLGVLSGGRVVHVDVLESPSMMRLAARIGETAPLHVTALGKALAAKMPEVRVRSILAKEGMATHGPRSISDADEYIDVLRETREQGYGVDDCEAQEDGRCIAVALDGIDIQAAISLSAPAIRVSSEELPAIGERLKKAARSISRSYTKAFGDL
ncbi:UNVERIFIED_CONTAM: IclR family transcriptional regulator [Microbacterium sp. SLM126]